MQNMAICTNYMQRARNEEYTKIPKGPFFCLPQNN